jgi:hypothetical protein
MTKIIPNSFKNARCKTCDKRFAVGEDVRWTKGGGATCVVCPAQGELPMQPAQPTISVEALHANLSAALVDGQALRKRIGELEAKLKVSEEVRLASAAHVMRLMATTEAFVNDPIKYGRLHDATRRVAQEAKALLLTGKIDERHTQKLRTAFAHLEAVNLKPAVEEHEPWLGDPAVLAAAQLSPPALVEAASNALDTNDDDDLLL